MADQEINVPVEPAIARSDDFQIVYANHVRMRLTPFDIGLVAGFSDDDPSLGLVASEKVMLVMAPAVAKQVAFSLTEAVKLYESQQGTIGNPDSFRPDSAEIAQAARRVFDDQGS